MIYNKTCLYSATAGQSTVNLSEPLSAFERYVVKVSPGVYWESICTADRSVQRFNRYGDWNHQGYMNWPANWVISNGTKTMTCNRFQMLSQNSAVNAVNAFGWGNTASNIKHLYEVWGINRKDPIETEGSGKPQGEGWKEYNETLLWSGTDYANQSVINLSGRALEYERLKVGVGSFGESTNLYEVDAPTTYDSWLPLYSYWGTNTGSFYYSNHRYQWGNETQTISAISGKTWQLGTAAANPFKTTGNYTSTDTFVRRPLFAIWGINHKKPNKLTLLDSEGGSISASRTNGYEFDIATLTNTTANEDYKFSSYNITGATLTGDQLQFGTNDVKVQGNFEHNKTLTLIDGEHAVLSADKDKGFIGDVVTVTGTMDEGWYLTGFNSTGATMTGNKFAFAGEDVTVEGLYTDVGFPVVYEAEKGVHLAGDTQIAIPGVGVNLTTSYDTYYRTNGYDITGGYIENGMLYATAACTARLKSKLNAFTATGTWDKGSNVNKSRTSKSTSWETLYTSYAIHGAHTGNVPTAWYNSSNRWKPNGVSGYSMNMRAKATVRKTGGGNVSFRVYTVLNGSTTTNMQTWSNLEGNPVYKYYDKTVSTSYCSTAGYYIKSQFYANTNTTVSYAWGASYLASGTNGSWTATGYAP
jgi:hypothetical protein